MTVYIINITIMLIMAYWLFFDKKKDRFKNANKIFCIVAAAQWILISGLRDITVGPDTIGYGRAFENVKMYSWDYVLQLNYDYLFRGLETKDPGYTLLTKIFQIFCGDYQVFLIFIAVVFTVPMAIWIYKNSEIPWLSFIIFSTLFYSFFAITGHRQTIATSLVVFIGYKYIKERKLIKFLILSFIAFMIHKSSVIFIVYYFIANIKLSRTYVKIVAVVAVIIIVLGHQIYAPIAMFFGFGEGMIDSEVEAGMTFVFCMLLVCAASFILYKQICARREDARFLYNAMFLTMITTLLVMQNQSFMRIQQYFSLFIMLMIPEIVSSLKKREATIVSVAGTALLVLLLVRNNPQYLFFWQN